MSLPVLAAIYLILFGAALAKAVIGFGDSMLAIPLLTLLLGLKTAAPLVGLYVSLATLIMLIRYWRDLNVAVVWRLLAAAAVGIPLGALGLKFLPETGLRVTLGGVLILTGLFQVARITLPPLSGERWSYVFGFLAGLCGGAYNMTGPPVIVFVALRRWSPDETRITLQGFFMPVNVMVLIGQASAGLWTMRVLELFVVSLPAMVGALWLGGRVTQRFAARDLARVMHIAMIGLGALLLF